MHLFEVLAGDMGIYLGGRNIDMTEHYLHGSQVGAAFQQVGCKRMSQAVGGNFFIQMCLSGVSSQQFPKPLTGHGFCRPGNEDERTDSIFQESFS